MNKSWACVFIATVFEVLWVMGLKHASSLAEWIGTALCIGATFVLLTYANKKLPIGTTYIVFTGIGTVGTVLIDSVVFQEALSVVKVALIVVLLLGVIGLKRVTKAPEMISSKVGA